MMFFTFCRWTEANVAKRQKREEENVVEKIVISNDLITKFAQLLQNFLEVTEEKYL